MGRVSRRARQLDLVFSPTAKRKFAVAAAGSAAVAIMETIAILLVAPLLQLLMGADSDTGVLGAISDKTGVRDRDQLLYLLLGAVVGGFVVKDLFTVVFRWWMTGFVNRERATTYVALLRYYLSAPYALHLERSTAQMMRVLGNSAGQLFALVALGLVGVITDGLTVLIIACALVVAAPTYSLGLLLFLTVAALIVSRAIRPLASRAGRRQLELSEAGYRTAFHALGGVKEIQIRHAQDHYLGEYRGIEMEAAHTHRVIAFLAELPKHVLEIAFFIAFFLLTFVVVSTQGSATLVTTIGILAAGAFRVLPALSRMLSSVSNIRAGLPALDDVASDLAAARALPAPQPPATRALPFAKELVVEDVSFRYGEEHPLVLHEISLTIPAGSSIAFVGTSGAGKSTLVDTILGLHSPTSGRVLVDGQDIAADPAAWHANISVVPQEVYLLDASVRENIAFDQDPSAIDDDLVLECLRQAQLTDLIDSLPDGIETAIGERGSRLSGGQRQRLGVARALYRQPRLLVLDEATSALDNETERRITETIAALHGSVTVIVVAHRLSTIRDVDTVAFLSQGRIAAMGSFDDVRQKSEEFNNLAQLASIERADGSLA